MKLRLFLGMKWFPFRPLQPSGTTAGSRAHTDISCVGVAGFNKSITSQIPPDGSFAFQNSEPVNKTHLLYSTADT